MGTQLTGVSVDVCILKDSRWYLVPREAHTTCAPYFPFYKWTLKKLRHIARRHTEMSRTAVLITGTDPIRGASWRVYSYNQLELYVFTSRSKTYDAAGKKVAHLIYVQCGSIHILSI